MVARIKATPSLSIIDALDSLANQVRKFNPQVPDNIVIILASGKTGRGSKHGHFAPESWDGDHHEILISAESLQRGAEATLGTLIHELAHATAQATGVRDTSNNNRYHNKKFKAIAEDLGIELAEAPTIGWSVTTLPEATANRYRAGLEKLSKSLVTFRKGYSEGAVVAPKPPKKSKAPMVCGCDDPVTVSIQWFERQGDVVFCAQCGESYTMVEQDEDDAA